MALKNVQRVTFSLPKTVIYQLEMHVPKSQRSKFVADLINKNIPAEEGDFETALAEVHEFFEDFRKKYKRKTNKTAVELQREDRLSH